jgi:hypothetical protein
VRSRGEDEVVDESYVRLSVEYSQTPSSESLGERRRKARWAKKTVVFLALATRQQSDMSDSEITNRTSVRLLWESILTIPSPSPLLG